MGKMMAGVPGVKGPYHRLRQNVGGRSGEPETAAAPNGAGWLLRTPPTLRRVVAFVSPAHG